MRILISLTAVNGNPSFSLSVRTILSATTSPVVLSRALYTLPYVPSPICESTLKASMHLSPQAFDRNGSSGSNGVISPDVLVGVGFPGTGEAPTLAGLIEDFES